MGEPLPGVSVIVAAGNAAATLRACLVSLHAVRYNEFEIIVADDGSTDETREIARSFPGVRVIETGGGGPSAARNAAVAISRYDIVAFTDADCAVPPQWLEALVGGLRDSKAACAGGPQENVFETTVAQSPVAQTPVAQDFSPAKRDVEALHAFFALASVVAEYTRADDRPREVDHNASCNSAYIKSAFLEAGGFSEGLFPGEDVDLDYRLRRLGYRCFYVPSAKVRHHRPGTMEWFAGMMRRYGRAQRELVKRHGPFRPLHYLPIAVVLLAASQLLWVPRVTRPAIAVLDVALLAGGVFALARAAPVALWPDVLRYAAVAMTEWHRGYAEGLQPGGARHVPNAGGARL